MPIDLNILDDNQRAAVLDTDGYAAIIAGAGSGKTRVLASRVAYLLGRGVRPEEILCVTFTNKTADEMRSRIEDYSGRNSSEMPISTYHSLCAGILRHYGDAIGISPDFFIYETAETTAVLNKVFHDSYIRELSLKQLRGEIDRFKACFLNLDEWHTQLECMHGRWYADDFVRGLEAYEVVMRSENALDFSDLTRNTVRLLKERPDILRDVSYRYILVDEYQDSSPVEAELVRLLSLHYGNLCVVGDPRQSIYGWRGSDYRMILNFEKTYPGAKKHVLNINYRSARKIVEAAEILSTGYIGRGYQCRPFRSDEGRLVLMEHSNSKEECKAIAVSIGEMTGSRQFQYSDIAILCRMHTQCRSVEAALSHNNLPYTSATQLGFYDKPEVKAVFDYLRVIARQQDLSVPIDIAHDSLQSLRLLYNCGISLTTLYDAVSAEVMRALRYGPTAAELANANLKALRVITTNYSGAAVYTLPAFMEACQVQSAPTDAVSVMTVHAAKGLEFPVVFISGLDCDSISFSKARSTEEEDRLMYVAATRASEELLLVTRPD